MIQSQLTQYNGTDLTSFLYVLYFVWTELLLWNKTMHRTAGGGVSNKASSFLIGSEFRNNYLSSVSLTPLVGAEATHTRFRRRPVNPLRLRPGSKFTMTIYSREDWITEMPPQGTVLSPRMVLQTSGMPQNTITLGVLVSNLLRSDECVINRIVMAVW
jgi:hypothetical protein